MANITSKGSYDNNYNSNDAGIRERDRCEIELEIWNPNKMAQGEVLGLWPSSFNKIAEQSVPRVRPTSNPDIPYFFPVL